MVGNEKAANCIKDIYSGLYENPLNPKEFGFGTKAEDGTEGIAMCELHAYRGNVHISFIYSYPHKMGFGTKLLNLILEKADEHGVVVELVPWDKGNTPKSVLIKWYKKHGFHRLGKNDDLLVREPKDSGRLGLHVEEGINTLSIHLLIR